MNCKQVSQLLLSYLDNEVSPEDREAIEAHLSVCGSCRDELGALANTLGELRQGLDEIAAGASPSPHAWWSIREKVLREEKKTPAFDIGGLRRRLTSCGFGTAVGWERAAVAAVLIGVMLFGLLSIPVTRSIDHSFPSIPSPVTYSLGALQVSDNLGDDRMTKFGSYAELEDFVVSRGTEPPVYSGSDGGQNLGEYIYDNVLGALGIRSSSEYTLSAPKGEGNSAVPDYSSGSQSFSKTNIQVEGVDEADSVKTDGRYIYNVVGNKIVVVRAYPASRARVVSEIDLEGSIGGLYINGERLIAFETVEAQDASTNIYQQRTYANVYNVSNAASPVLEKGISIDGVYWDSRMVGDYVYVVANHPVYSVDDQIQLPKIYLGDTVNEISAEEILHPDQREYETQFTTIASINVGEEAQEVERVGYASLLLENTSAMYVSQNNIYITSYEYNTNTGYVEGTTVHRLHLEDGGLTYDATGEVKGTPLNQFSMDEYEGYFRIATTTGNTWDASSRNHVYVLDDSLNIAGSLENLAPGESIYSARFMGNRCYLVTFKKVDPFFVIDLGNPQAPELLGQLKITGYSDYLHPYDENHIIGVGKETADSGYGDFSWYQGVKISLFDVSDVNNPKEIAKYEIGDRGTDSPVLTDHKAFLFDSARNLLVIPVLVAEIDQSAYSGEVPAWAYGDYVWQGAYVFDISLDEGLQLRGRITHYDDGYDSYDALSSVKRSLYIEDVLYTISDAKVKMNDLGSLDYINEVELPEVEASRTSAVEPDWR